MLGACLKTLFKQPPPLRSGGGWEYLYYYYWQVDRFVGVVVATKLPLWDAV